jgi:hypothetical protein
MVEDLENEKSDSRLPAPEILRQILEATRISVE